MKTAISIPDQIFEAADLLAQRLGLSRSELYARAVARFVEGQENEDIRARLDEVYGQESNALDEETWSLQFESLEQEDW